MNVYSRGKSLSRHCRGCLLKQAGFVMPLALLVATAFALLIASGMAGYENSLQMLNREQFRIEKTNLDVTFHFLYLNPSNCTSWFIADAGGEVSRWVQTARSGSAPPNAADLSLNFPGAPVKAFVASDLSLGRMSIRNARITDIRRVGASMNAFVINVSANFSSPIDVPAPAPLIKPFYVVTDAAGTPTQCFVTDYLADNVTLEDQVCETAVGSGYYFQPEAGTCVN